jgi:hypothetical protein
MLSGVRGRVDITTRLDGGAGHACNSMRVVPPARRRSVVRARGTAVAAQAAAPETAGDTDD